MQELQINPTASLGLWDWWHQWLGIGISSVERAIKGTRTYIQLVGADLQVSPKIR